MGLEYAQPDHSWDQYGMADRSVECGEDVEAV